MSNYRNSAITVVLTLLLAACSEQTEVAENSTVVTDESATAKDENAAVVEQSTSAVVTTTCDRTCIIGVTNAYLSALAAHDPGAAPLADNVRFVENIKAMTPGEGLWQSIVSGPGSFQIFVPDEIKQTVGYLGMMRYMAAPPAPSGISPEERAEFAANAEKTEQPVLVALRLQLAGGKITEVEHLLATISETVNNDPDSPFAGRPAPISRLQTPRPGLLAEIQEDKRMDHDKLIEIGLSYYDALDDNDGTLMPFAEDCQRHENGMVTAGPELGGGTNIPGANSNQSATTARDCVGQLNSKTFTYIDRIENRRVFAADPVTGLVIGFSHFRHPMDNLPYEVVRTDGSTVTFDKERMPFAPFDLPAAHIYKIGADGLVHEIEAMGFVTSYNAPTGWE